MITHPKLRTMIPPIVSALLLPCVGMAMLFVVYLFLLWCVSGHAPVSQSPEKLPEKKGLSAEELQKLPKTTAGGDKLIGTECAVCLDEIESGQPGRLLPGCNHGFHLHCADAWLSKNRICPLCRAILHPNEIINSDHDDSPC